MCVPGGRGMWYIVPKLDTCWRGRPAGLPLSLWAEEEEMNLKVGRVVVEQPRSHRWSHADAAEGVRFEAPGCYPAKRAELQVRQSPSQKLQTVLGRCQVMSHVGELRSGGLPDPSPLPHKAPKRCIQACHTQNFGGSQCEAEKQQSKEEADRCLSRAGWVYRKDYSEVALILKLIFHLFKNPVLFEAFNFRLQTLFYL